MTTTANIDLCFALQDMTPDEIFADKKFAQELELAKKASFLSDLPTNAEVHSCSERIQEIDKLYSASKEDRLRYFQVVQEHYKDKLPLG
jgi:hypothetical protein